ncbi:MAG: hypothetical protein HZB91_05260 [Elusimicrobia bacterium]|nr:hypothetical protein [Elusimicrobiota bacterium]
MVVLLCLGSIPAASQTIRVPPKTGSGVHAVSALPSVLREVLTTPSISAAAGISLSPSIAAPAIPDPLPAAAPEQSPLSTLKSISEAAPSSKDPIEREEQSKEFWRQALGEAQAAPDDGAGAGEDKAQAWSRLPAERSSQENQARWNAALSEARKKTPAEVRRLLKMRAAGPKVHAELATSDTKTITEYRGVPGRIEALPEDGRVYRHWVRNAADLESILASGLLRAGPVSYVEFTRSRRAFIKDIFLDLKGPFFTAPENKANEPRVMNEDVEHFVDFRLPPGVAALSLDGTTVMMIPAEPGTFLPIEIVGSSPAP